MAGSCERVARPARASHPPPLVEPAPSLATFRMLYAFSRDGAVPGSRWWHSIHPRTKTPVNAVWLSVLAAFVLGLPMLNSTMVRRPACCLLPGRRLAAAPRMRALPCPAPRPAGLHLPDGMAPHLWRPYMSACCRRLQVFTAVTSIATVGLYISYVVPSFLRVTIVRADGSAGLSADSCQEEERAPACACTAESCGHLPPRHLRRLPTRLPAPCRPARPSSPAPSAWACWGCPSASPRCSGCCS